MPALQPHPMEIPATRLAYAEWKEPFELAILATQREAMAAYRSPEGADAFLHAVWLAFRRNPVLQKCSPESITESVISLALSGLDITQPGEAWLIPHENSKKDVHGKFLGKVWEVVLWDGYLGRIKLARQHPDVQDVWCDAVRAKDTYQFNGRAALPQHAYPPMFGERGAVIGAYAVAQLVSGLVVCLQMSKAEVLAHRDQYSKGRQGDVWQERYTAWENGRRVEKGENRSFEKMVAKTVISQLCHPRNIPMLRVASAIIAQQERVLEALKPLTGEAMQPTAPVVARASAIEELFPTRDASAKQDLLDTIRSQFVEHAAPLLNTKASREALTSVCFGCKDWTELPALPAERLTQGVPRWDACLDLLAAGIPAMAEAWDVPAWMHWFLGTPLPEELSPEDGVQEAGETPSGALRPDWRQELAALIPHLTSGLKDACVAALKDPQTTPERGNDLLHMAMDTTLAAQEAGDETL